MLSTAFRNFKHTLMSEHILPYKDNLKRLKKPMLQSSFIRQAHWEQFVPDPLIKDFVAYVFSLVFFFLSYYDI